MNTATPQNDLPLSTNAVDARQQPAAIAAYAGFWRRFAAVVIDSVIVSIPANSLAASFGAVVIVTSSGVHYRSQSSWLETVLMILYETWLISSWNGQTVGKRLMGIRVVSRDGGPISPTDALVRSVMKLVSAAAILLGYLWMLWDPRKQTWHDKIAGTFVVKDESGGAGLRG